MRDKLRNDGRLGLPNVLLALISGAAVVVSLLLFGVPGLDPSLWGEVNVASGVYPPINLFPGYWRALVGWLFTHLGNAVAIKVLSVVGAAVAGVCVALFYLIVRETLALLIRTTRNYHVWYARIAPFCAIVATLCFGLGDPLRRIARNFSPDELLLLMLLILVYLSLRWFTIGGQWRLFVTWALMGLMAAETPFAFALPIAFVIAYVLVWHAILDEFIVKPEALPEPSELPKWRMFFLFLGGLAIGALINGSIFTKLGGVVANGWQPNDVYFRYASGYSLQLFGACSLIGWVLGLCFGIFPLVAAIRVFPMVARDDQPMRFNLGVFMFMIGAMAVMQCGAFPATQFWTFTHEITLVNNAFLLVVFHASAMVALALSGAAFAFECQRVYLDRAERPGWALRGVVPLLMLILVAMVGTHIAKPVELEMQRIVDEAVQEIVRECGDANWVFTDGRLDAAIEQQAVAQGKSLRPLNLMSGASEWEINLRRRHFAVNSADREAAEIGVPMLFRTWQGEKQHGLDESAMMLGFELWKRDRKPLPRLSGMVGRTMGMSEEEAKAGIERSKLLADRILAIADQVEDSGASMALQSAWAAVNWRISRLARFRTDEDLADQLDLSNGALKRMLSLVEYERMRIFMQLTPREGLEIALRRADFKEARRYALSVLRNDEESPEANFGMGMSALTMNNLKEAEYYLKRCLIRRPDEPAALNNLSIICRKQHRYADALKYAKRALELLPSSTEVQKTLKDAESKAP